MKAGSAPWDLWGVTLLTSPLSTFQDEERPHVGGRQGILNWSLILHKVDREEFDRKGGTGPLTG